MKHQVTYEPTPNPQSLKFVLNIPICEEKLEINNRNESSRSPLAAKILGFPWAKSVFIGANFITITKEEWLEWDMISEPLAQMIKEHLDRGEKVVLKKQTPSKEQSLEEDSDTVQTIKNILTKEIQPAVAMDGGYIEFVSYENKKVYLSLQGACAGCPSSQYTLKEGIESRLKQSIPEIEEVISV
ncbi:MAG: NifU family protein [Bdellovibrionales bacterium]